MNKSIINELRNITNNFTQKRLYCALSNKNAIICKDKSFNSPDLIVPLAVIESLVADSCIIIDLRLLKATRYPPDLTINHQQFVPLDITSSITQNISLLSPDSDIYKKENYPTVSFSKTLQEKIEANSFDIFLAHNSNDKLLVLELGNRLRQRDIYPWIDSEQIPPGRWFQDIIQSAIKTVKAAAILIGDSGIGKWQILELRAFISCCIEQNIPLIPVLLPGVKKIPDELIFLRELNFISFEKEKSYEDVVSKIIWGITGKANV